MIVNANEPTARTDNPAHALLDGLTDPQREAVVTTEGPLLVLAAAGSGKTRVITRRIAYLLSLGVPAWQVLALTFTNKAAGEMRERVGELLEAHPQRESISRGLTVSTFHALCARLLRRYAPLMEGRANWRIKHDYTIYDTNDQQALMKTTLNALQLSTTNWPPRTVLGAISNAKNELKDAAAFAAEADDFYSRQIAKIYTSYDDAMRQANAVDFDDLMVLTVRLLRECDEARDEVQARWRYLMIDEYQDTNHAQFVLSTLLVGNDPGSPPNLCVVGDPDQSIYGWRGADIANILEFEQAYSGAGLITLGQNFRSTAPILAIADHLIRNNQQRKHKDLFTTRDGGEQPEAVLCRDERHEAGLVIDWLKARVEEEESLTWKDAAIFYRNNALSRVLEDELRREGVPYVIARGTAFYQREEVRDAIAYLKLVANQADEVSLLRIINKPARKIGKATIETLAETSKIRGVPMFEVLRIVDTLDLTPQAQRAVQRFTETVDGWTGHGTFFGEGVAGSLADLVSRVLKQSGLEDHYKKLAAKSEESADKLSNLQEIVSSAAEFEETYEPADDPALAPDEDDVPPLLSIMRAYLETVSLVADADSIDPASGAITLMTLHAAKGLEFPAVAIVGMEEGLLPSSRALESESGLEEERRLAFVGITRAMRRLLMTSAKYRTQRGLRERMIPSRFLDELPSEHVRVSDQSEESWDEGWDDAPAPWDEPTEASIESARRRRASRSSGSWPGIEPGARVRHPRFGLGTIAQVMSKGMNARAVVEFKDAGRKTLVLQYANLEVL
ncbi:MAG: UvrD-helicase domain-containing protein [Planctomycetota bacterium]